MDQQIQGLWLQGLSIALVGAGVLMLAFQVRIDRRLADKRAVLCEVSRG